MKTLNLKQFKIFTDYKRTAYVEADATDLYSDYLYKSVPGNNGVQSLIERITESGGVVHIGETDEKIIIDSMQRGMFTQTSDALLIALNTDKLNEKIGDMMGKSEMEIKETTVTAMRELLSELKSKL